MPPDEYDFDLWFTREELRTLHSALVNAMGNQPGDASPTQTRLEAAMRRHLPDAA